MAVYITKSLPAGIEKLTQLHKASTKQPLFYLNVFFGLGLLFFVISSFRMFLPKTTIFRKGLYFMLAGILLTMILLFIQLRHSWFLQQAGILILFGNLSLFSMFAAKFCLFSKLSHAAAADYTPHISLL